MSTAAQPTTPQQISTQVEQVYILFYRHGVNPQCQKGFKHRGDIRSAVERAKKHCEIMNYRYIFIRPLICDIDAEEKQKLEAQ